MKVKMYERKDTIVKATDGVVITKLVGLKCPAKELAEKGENVLSEMMCENVGVCLMTEGCCDRYKSVKGVAKCMPEDDFCENTGRFISETKAQQKYRDKISSDYLQFAQYLLDSSKAVQKYAGKHCDAYTDCSRKLMDTYKGEE